MRPRAGDDLSALPRDRVVVQTGFKPDHDYFKAQGYRTEGADPAIAILCVPRAKAEARAMMAQAMAAPVIVVDGQKTDGVESLLKDCKGLGLAVGEVISKAHGKLALVSPSDRLEEWAARPTEFDGFRTLPGVFSADAPDRGSVLLAQALPAKMPARVADIGAGWGYLSRAVLAHGSVKSLDLIEAEAVALDCARLNIQDPRAQFIWADAISYKTLKPWDMVVMNPPFHTGRDAEASLGMGFIKAAHRGLLNSGQLLMVANRHLPYEPLLASLFKQVEIIGGDSAFRVTRAAYPIRGK